MMKLLSQEWIAAEQENKKIRDALRDKFWAGIEGKRVSDLSDIDIAPTDRLGNMEELLAIAGQKVGDGELLRIAELAGSALSMIAPGSLLSSGPVLPFSVSDFTPEARASFFANDVAPTSVLTKKE